jgi:hypothetical protein
MIRGVCHTGPVRERTLTAAHRKAKLPAWVTTDLCDAVLSVNPAMAVKESATAHRAAGRITDASMLESEARAFGVLPRANGEGWATTEATTREMAAARLAKNGHEPAKETPSEAYGEALKGFQKRLDDDASALAKRYREQVMVPACRKHRLGFAVIQGDFWFYPKSTGYDLHDNLGRNVSSSEYIEFSGYSKAAQATLKPILDMLNTNAQYNQCFGYLIEDIEP